MFLYILNRERANLVTSVLITRHLLSPIFYFFQPSITLERNYVFMSMRLICLSNSRANFWNLDSMVSELVCGRSHKERLNLKRAWNWTRALEGGKKSKSPPQNTCNFMGEVIMWPSMALLLRGQKKFHKPGSACFSYFG